jgi:hypothetical protein
MAYQQIRDHVKIRLYRPSTIPVPSIVMKYLSLVFATLLVAVWAPAHAQTAATFLVLPFRDASGFGGDHWDIAHNLPRALSDTLTAVPGYGSLPPAQAERIFATLPRRWRSTTIPPELRQVAEEYGARYAVVGTITEFAISRFDVGSPMLAGYGSYRVKIQVQFKAVDLRSGTDLAKRTAAADVKNRQLGLTLLGKSAGEGIDYDALDEMEFDSEQFRQTLAGQAMHELKADFVSKLRAVVPADEDEIRARAPFHEAKVVLVREREVYLAAGEEDGVQPGDEFDVYTTGEELRDPDNNVLLGHADKRVGKIRIEAVRDQHLSLAVIVEGAGAIRLKDRVRIRVDSRAQ